MDMGRLLRAPEPLGGAASAPSRPRDPASGSSGGRGRRARCTQTIHFTYEFQAPTLYKQTGYELVGQVEDFPSGTNVLWYRKRLNRSAGRRRSPESLDG